MANGAISYLNANLWVAFLFQSLLTCVHFRVYYQSVLEFTTDQKEAEKHFLDSIVFNGRKNNSHIHLSSITYSELPAKDDKSPAEAKARGDL